MIRFMLASTLLHICLLSMFWQPQVPAASTALTSIELLEGKQASKPAIGALAPAPPDLLTPSRVSSEGNDSLPLDKRLAANTYIERIKGFVEPEWRQNVLERIKLLKRMGRSWTCTACVEGVLKANGSMASVVLTQSCADSKLSQIALEALDKQLPPPPSSLLKNEQLILAWCFATR
jgi:hypothetical protein